MPAGVSEEESKRNTVTFFHVLPVCKRQDLPVLIKNEISFHQMDKFQLYMPENDFIIRM